MYALARGRRGYESDAMITGRRIAEIIMTKLKTVILRWRKKRKQENKKESIEEGCFCETEDY
jgi:hypothetical protein